LPESVHPAARILLWGGWAIGIELVTLPQLYSMAVVSATAFIFPSIRQAAWRLLYRARWLLLILLLSYAYTLPGELVWPRAGGFSPTEAGLQAGGVRILRLSLMLVALAVLLSSTARARLIYGLYCLARPLALLGLDRRALAVRLGLTLAYVEQTPQSTSWLQRLRQPEPLTDHPTVFSLSAQNWKWHDSLAILLALGVALLAWL